MIPKFTSCFLLMLLLGTGRVLALVMDPLSIETMTRQADLVLQGKVLSTTCLRDNAGRIYTRVELEVSDVWKGSIAGSPFLIVHGGGILGEEYTQVAGQVQYEIGKEVVAFLVRNARGEGVTLGLMQGKFDVWQEAHTGVKHATNPFHGRFAQMPAGLARQSTAGGKHAPTDLASPLPLTVLKKQVQEAQR